MYTARILLAAPQGTPEQIPAEANWDRIRRAVQHVAVQDELMDPREERFVFMFRDDFLTDLELIRRRRAELEDAPLLAECHRLPIRAAANELIKFNRMFRNYLEQRQGWESDRAGVLEIVIEETDQLYQLWDSIRDAQCDFYYVTVRRNALLKYKRAIGERNYLDGKTPDYVPHWRFETAR